jgi:hypothetical protein
MTTKFSLKKPKKIVLTEESDIIRHCDFILEKDPLGL